MKKMPRKFSEGGTAQPKPAEPKKKPVDNMPDWAKKDLEAKNADAKTKQGYEKATAEDRLKKFKKGGSIKKFSEGKEVAVPSSETYRFNPDTYEKARRYIETGKGDDDAGPAGAIKEPPGAEKSKPKTKPAAKPAVKPAEKKDDYSNEGRNAPAPKPRSNPRFTEPERDVTKMSDMDRYFANRAKTTDTSRVLPPPIASESGATPMERARADKLRQARQEQLDKRMSALREASKSKGFEEDFPDSRSPSERSMDRGDRLKRAVRGLFGLKDEYKSGGKVAKYAKGGGIESKGKTKGTVVKMAKGGSVKGWGISRGAKACKMV